MSDDERRLRIAQFSAYMARIERATYHGHWNGQVSQQEIWHAQRLPYESDIA